MAMTTERRIGTVLVVDDSELFLRSSKRELMRDDRHALTATGHAEALEILGRENVDLVVIDVVLGGSSGIDLLEDIKRAHPTLRAVVMSGLFSNHSLKRAFRAGAFDCVDKPLEWHTLLHAVDQEKRLSEHRIDEIPSIEEVERDYYNRLVEVHHGNVTKAAERIGIRRTSLQRIRRRFKRGGERR